jgi:hypothetical protein
MTLDVPSLSAICATRQPQLDQPGGEEVSERVRWKHGNEPSGQAN